MTKKQESKGCPLNNIVKLFSFGLKLLVIFILHWYVSYRFGVDEIVQLTNKTDMMKKIHYAELLGIPLPKFL